MKTDELFEVNPSKGCDYRLFGFLYIFVGCEPHPVLPSLLKIAEKNLNRMSWVCCVFFRWNFMFFVTFCGNGDR